jgi:ferredoxin
VEAAPGVAYPPGMHEVRLLARGGDAASDEARAGGAMSNAPGRTGPTWVRHVRVPAGTTLLAAVAQAGLPIARACGGSGLCGRCGVRVLAGGASLAPESPEEARAKARNRVPSEERLACRCRVEGPLSLSASYW